MLVAIGSSKGSPGATTAALVLAAAWPRPVAVLEADPTGGDLAYRCRIDGGAAVQPKPSLVDLAAAVRSGVPDRAVIWEYTQPLACGVQLVPGVVTPGQGRGLGRLWPQLAAAAAGAPFDVIVDVGRVDREAAVRPLLTAADRVLIAAAATLEQVMHLREILAEVGAVVDPAATRFGPLLVGPDAHAEADRAEVDEFVTAAGSAAQPTLSLVYEPRSVQRLERGEEARGRLRRTLLTRSAQAVARQLLAEAGAQEGEAS